MICKLDSIILFVKNIETLKNFYGTALGFEIIEEIPNEWIVFKTGDVNLALHQMGESDNQNDTNPFSIETNTKIVFEIRDNIYDIRSTLISQGIKMKEIVSFENFNYWFCDGQDPEGNIFQLKQKRESR